MIITARVALGQANKILGRPKNWEKAPIRQLKKIERKINRASKNGKTLLKYHGNLLTPVRESLVRNHFKLEDFGNYDYSWVVIHWNETI